MRNLQRSIIEARSLRGDLSNYLIHLTKPNAIEIQKGVFKNYTAKQCLEKILSENALYGSSRVGQFAHKSYEEKIDANQLKAVCFTEAPIEQIYLFIGIEKRGHKFESYGLAFDMEELVKPPVRAAPVLYFPQSASNDFHYKDKFDAILLGGRKEMVNDVLFLFDRFGKHAGGGDYNWRWEREWRVKDRLEKVKVFAKFGLCPETDIDEFEKNYSLCFVDPFFHPEQIRTKLKKKGVIKS